jgi:TRAP-type mannitol/chloroaromatic compound transport system substrate-binding protein
MQHPAQEYGFVPFARLVQSGRARAETIILGGIMVSFLKSVAQGVVAATVAVTAAQATDTIRWKVPGAFPSQLPALSENAGIVADILDEISGGSVQFNFFEPGNLLLPLELTDAVQNGSIQAGYTWVGYHADKIPSSPLFAARPFGMDPWEHTAWWYEGGGQQLGEEVYGKRNVHPILCGINGPETAGWFRRKITSIRNFQGLKVRYAGLGGKVMQDAGASLTLLPGSDIFQYFPGWHQTYTAFHLIVNRDVWNGLEGQTKAMINTACSTTTLRSLSRSQAAPAGLIRGFSETGVLTQKLPVEMLEQLAELTEAVMEAQAAEDEDFKRVYESQRVFADGYQARRELGYLLRSFSNE